MILQQPGEPLNGLAVERLTVEHRPIIEIIGIGQGEVRQEFSQIQIDQRLQAPDGESAPGRAIHPFKEFFHPLRKGKGIHFYCQCWIEGDRFPRGKEKFFCASGLIESLFDDHQCLAQIVQSGLFRGLRPEDRR